MAKVVDIDKGVMRPIQVNDKVVDAIRERNATKKRLEQEDRQSHDKLWETVYEQYPELDQDKNYTLHSRFIDSGVVMLIEKDEDSPLGRLGEALRGAFE